jgi:WD40 repeat protein
VANPVGKTRQNAVELAGTLLLHLFRIYLPAMMRRYARIRVAVLAIVLVLAAVPIATSPAQAALEWVAVGGLDDRVEDIAFGPDGTLYAGGQFTGNVASWNGTTWATLGTTGPGIGDVTSLAFDTAGNLYAGGSTTPFVRKWNGTTWSDLTGYPPAAGVEALLYSGGDLYAAGDTAGTGYAASWDGATWTALNGGSLSDTVYSLAAWSDGTILAGSGDNAVFTLSGTTWTQLGGSLGATVYSIAVGPGDVTYAGRNFAPFVSVWNAGTSSWDATNPALSEPPGTGSARMYALLVGSDGTLYAGGFYDLIGLTEPLTWMGILSSGTWTSPGTSFFNARIYDFALDSSGTLYAAGAFTGVVARLGQSSSPGGGQDGSPVRVVITLDAGEGAACQSSSIQAVRNTWATLPGADACTAPFGSDRTLLGWATRSDFPIASAQRQVDNGWGAYELTDESGRTTAVFIPAGGSTLLTNDNRLHAIWS